METLFPVIFNTLLILLGITYLYRKASMRGFREKVEIDLNIIKNKLDQLETEIDNLKNETRL